MEKSWIFGSWFTRKDYFDLVKKIQPKKIDFISQGYVPKFGTLNSEDGILYSWKGIPLGLWDVPTLNGMVFSRALWEDVRNNEFVKASLEMNSLWGEDRHREDAEVFWDNVVLRVSNFWCAENNLVLGDVDLMDTFRALPIYACGKTGAVGNSSRGFGELKLRNDGLNDVVREEYAHVGWDAVTFPAVPSCLTMRTVETAIRETPALDALTKQLRDSVNQAYEQNPTNELVSQMFMLMNGYLSDKDKNKPVNSGRFTSDEAAKKLFA